MHLEPAVFPAAMPKAERSLPCDVHGDFDGTPLLVDNVQVAGAREKVRPLLNAANKAMCCARGDSRQVTPPHVKARMPKKQIQEASHGSWNVLECFGIGATRLHKAWMVTNTG